MAGRAARQFRVRRATAADQKQITALIRAVRINPWALDWRHFLVAVAEQETMIGCGQVRPHRDGSRELASIAVTPAWRGRGVARALIEQLLADAGPPLWLTCVSSMVPLYQKFGFRQVTTPSAMPPYFWRLYHLARLFLWPTHSNKYLAFMVWEQSADC
jgi:amino-acid N-acetyltransferase